MFLVLLALIALFFPASVHAQDIPMSYQLMMAFRPSSLVVVTPTPTPNPKVLGVSTSNTNPEKLPAIGGEGRTVTIALLGDSMIDTLGKNVTPLQKALANFYPGLTFNILNYGYGASTIEQAIGRLNYDYNYNGVRFANLLSQNPDIIVIESFAYNNFGNTQSGYDRQWSALGSITGTIKQKLPNTKIVIATTIAPNSITFANNAPNIHFSGLEKVEKVATIRLYLENAINFAKSQNYPLADAYHPSLTGNSGNPNFINIADHIHPSALGAQLFNQILATTIKNNHLLD